MFRKFFLIALSVVLAGIALLPAGAQGNELATGLNFPRGIAFDDAGNLYIAEAGMGGDQSIEMVVPGGDPEAAGGPSNVSLGASSRVTVVAPDGTQSALLSGLVSIAMGPESLGVVKAQAVGDALWVLLSEGAPGTIFNTALLELDRETLRIRRYIDLMAYEIANNPDGTEEIYSNPSDFVVAEDGTVFIVDTGANTLYTWTADSDLQVFHAWGDDPVPTSIDFGPDGAIYVGFLGTGIAPGAGHIEQWSAAGELLNTYGGMTAVTDILVDDVGTIYAVQMMQFGEQGPAPASGTVVTVTADGLTPFAEGLNMPYGIAQSPDGTLVVSTNTAFTEPGSGTVVAIN